MYKRIQCIRSRKRRGNFVRSNTTNRSSPLHFAWRLFILHELENDARRTIVDVDRFSSQKYRSIRELTSITCMCSEKKKYCYVTLYSGTYVECILILTLLYKMQYS